MLLQFQQHIQENFSKVFKSNIGIAISGGVDSVVLLDLFLKSGIQVSLLHCNFQLRGTESDGDKNFVEGLASKYKLPFFTINFETLTYAKKNKTSIQIAARELRYSWFKQIATEQKIDKIALAHHMDDSVETFLINLSRGTGLEGLTGIPKENSIFFRPLLPFSKDEILEYAKENCLLWREDSSNKETKYVRNFLRQEVIPKLKELTPSFLNNFKNSQQYISKSQDLVTSYVASFRKQHFNTNKDIRGYQLDIEVLKKENNIELVLFEILKDFGFKAWEDIQHLITSQTGKKVCSKTHTLLKNRNHLLLFPTPEKTELSYKLGFEDTQLKIGENFILKKEENLSEASIALDADKLKFPLHIRRRKEGDIFFPIGMKGKKKVSKYFKDEKFSQLQKQETWLLCSGNEVIWIIGYRVDRRFSVTPETKKTLMLSYNKLDSKENF